MINKVLLQKHRNKTKQEILNKLKTCDRFGVVRPVGYGKSYIMTQLCNELPGKKLIFEPRDEIINYINKFGNIENTDTLTYHSLLSKKFDHSSLLNYDYIFLDEMHRALAKKWGKTLKEDLKDYKGKLVGFSATPERTDLKNSIDEIFDGEQIEPLYLVDAIKQNLLPQITYVTSIYEIDKKFYKNESLKKKLKAYNITNNLKNMFNEYLNFNKSLHILVFNSNIKDIQQNIKYISSWIDRPINVHECYHTINDTILKDNINKFINSTSGINIMFCVNMFNEGIHLKNLDAVIFLRKTSSNIIYNQQLGRLISEYNDNAIVFDLVNNAYYLDTGYLSIWNEEAKRKNCKIEDIELDNKEKLKIYKKQEDIISLLLSLSYTFKHLSEEEKKYIEENRLSKGVTEIAKDLSRNYSTIRSYLKYNNLKYVTGVRSLTKKEKKYIEENRLNKTPIEIAKDLNRSVTIIKTYLKDNNLKYCSKRTLLTKKEKKYIEKNRLNKSIPKIAKDLNRNVTTIRKYLKDNNLKYIIIKSYLSKEEKKYIEENRLNKTPSKIAKDLNRNTVTIRKYLKDNNLDYKTIIK